MLVLLHKYGINFDQTCEYGMTPLFYAAELNHISLTKYLVENKVDVNHKCK